ncbi:MAG: hypothetical protein ACLTCI_00080 [[Clostridium] nexile]
MESQYGQKEIQIPIFLKIPGRQITFRYKNGKEDVLTENHQQKESWNKSFSREAVQDDSFEGFCWIYGFSNRCDWTQIDAFVEFGIHYKN